MSQEHCVSEQLLSPPSRKHLCSSQENPAKTSDYFFLKKAHPGILKLRILRMLEMTATKTGQDISTNASQNVASPGLSA
jgi:hypothetical protein